MDSVDQKIISQLANTRTFSGLETETMAALLKQARKRTLAAGETLFLPGDEFREAIYVLLAGTLSMRRSSGVERDVLTGDLVGLANYLDNAPYSSAVVAVTEVRLMELPAETMRSMERTHPPLFDLLNRVIAFKLRERSSTSLVTSGILAQPLTRVMKSPVIKCGETLSIRAAHDLMARHNIGSIVVVDAEDRVVGLADYRTIAGAMINRQIDPETEVAKSGYREAILVAPDRPVWETQSLLDRQVAKCLVVAEGQNPIGVISQSDLLHALISETRAVAAGITMAATLDELRGIQGQILDIAKEARETNHSANKAVGLLSEAHLAIQRRTVELTQKEMLLDQLGSPPRPFAVLILGSGARKEMLLAPDQDNGLIYADQVSGVVDDADQWFEEFSRRMNANLDKVGYILCSGDVMASNKLYRKPISKWKRQLTKIADQPNEKAARWANVLFDFDTLYGDDSLTIDLRSHLLQELSSRPRLLGLMAQHDAEGRPAIGFFNQLINTAKVEQGERIDLKRNGLRLVADAARIFTLKNGFASRSTLSRLAVLARSGVFSPDFYESVREAFEELTDQLFRHQVQCVDAGKQPDTLVDPETLTAQSRGRLRLAMRAVKRLQERLQDELETTPY